MQIDVVIPTCNNFETKKFSRYYTPRSILSQSCQPKNIIIVENISYENTRLQIEKEFGSLVRVVDGTQNPKNISYVRNLGAREGNAS